MNFNFSTSLFDEGVILYGFVMLAFLAILIFTYSFPIIFFGIIVIFIKVTIALIWLYRYPSDEVYQTDGLLAPCDGVVKSIDFDPASGRYKLVVHLRIYDMYHQYYPVSGIVTKSQHIPGSYERHIMTMRTKLGEHIAITQIAGKILQHIVNKSVPGVTVKQGDYMGMIKFTSCVEVEFSKAHFIPSVSPGDLIKARQTPIASRLSNYAKLEQ